MALTASNAKRLRAQGLSAEEIAKKTKTSLARVQALLDTPDEEPAAEGLPKQTQEAALYEEQVARAQEAGWPLLRVGERLLCARYHDILPTLDEERFEALRASVLVGGRVEQDIVIDDSILPNIIDGYHRAQIVFGAPEPKPVVSFKVRAGLSENEKLALAYKLNTERRQLRPEDLKATALKLKSERAMSNPMIAALLGVNQATVWKWVQASGMVLPSAVVGADGKSQAARQAPAQPREASPAPAPAPVAFVPPDSQFEPMQRCTRCGGLTPVSQLTFIDDGADLCEPCCDLDAAEKEEELSSKESAAPTPEPSPTRTINQAATHTSKRQDHNTPPRVLDRVRQVGPIILDPCSNPTSLVGAVISFDEEQDGLSRHWQEELFTRELDPKSGLVFVNPPFDNDGEWAQKVIRQAALGLEIILLVKPKTGCSWFRDAALTSQQMAFFTSRVAYYNPDTGKQSDPAPFDTCLLYWGPRKGAFEKAFFDVCWFRYEVQP